MLDWSDTQRKFVAAVLAQHPAASNRCARAVELIYVQPRAAAGQNWFHHVTVGVAGHYVDALPGADGHVQATYLRTYFDFPDDHTIRPVEPEEWEEL